MVRLAEENDLLFLLPILSDAKELLKNSGSSQWQNGYPSLATLKNDLANHNLYVCIKDKTIVGYAVLIRGEDLNYDSIYEGEWLNTSKTYSTIHRLAVKKEAHNKKVGEELFIELEKIARTNSFSLRVDTHEKNLIMRHLIEKKNYSYCGIIFLKSDEEDNRRLAYEKILK